MVRAPMLRVAVPFIGGLVAGLYLTPGLVVSWAVLLGCFALWCWRSYRPQHYGRRWLPGVVCWAFFACLGVAVQTFHWQSDRSDHVGRLAQHARGWQVEITEVTSAKPRSMRAWAEVRGTVMDSIWQPACGGLLLTLLLDSMGPTPQRGDRLVLTTRISPIHRIPDPGGFDLRQWAGSRGVYHEAFAPVGNWRLTGQTAEGKDVFERMRDRINLWLANAGLPARERALTKALLLGQRDEMDADQNQAFIRSGTIHVLAVSGTHVGIIYVAVLWALRFLGKERRGRLIRGMVALAALWAYAGLTGFTPSVLRATVMFSLFTMAQTASWRTDSLNSLAFAAVLLLLWDPQLLGQLGFQLSFLAVLGIVVLYTPIKRLWLAPNAVADFFWSLCAVSLAAQAFTTPLCLYTFHAFPVWFLPANLAIVGLVGVGVYAGAVLLAVHTISVLGPAAALFMKGLLLLLGYLAGFFAGLPGAYPALRVGFWGMVGLYLFLSFLIVRLLQRKHWAGLAAMASLLALFLGWGWTARQRNHQQQIVVYQDREATTCSIVKGRTMYVFSNSTSPWVQRTIEQHMRAVGVLRVVRVDSLPLSADLGGTPYHFRQVDQLVNRPVPAGHDAVVLHGHGWLDMERLQADGRRAWVLGPDLDGGTRTRMQQWAQAQGGQVFSVRTDGAYVRP